MVKLRALLPLALACALVLPSCGEDNPAGLPDVPRAGIVVSVDPNPIEGVQSITGSVSVAFQVTVTETNGLGGEVVFVSSTIFDPETGAQVALSYFDSNDLDVFVGESRIEPGGSLEVPMTMSYILPDFRTEAELTASAQFRDDRGNLVNSSLLVKIL
jgi:hypothetical protein